MSTSTLAMTLQGYHLTFDAEFDDYAAPLLFQDGGAFYPDLQWFGNLRTLSYSQEQETYVDPSYAPDPVSPFSVANGLLTITARPTPGLPTPWSSGALDLGHLRSKYAYFEMRAELPASQACGRPSADRPHLDRQPGDRHHGGAGEKRHHRLPGRPAAARQRLFRRLPHLWRAVGIGQDHLLHRWPGHLGRHQRPHGQCLRGLHHRQPGGGRHLGRPGQFHHPISGH